MRRRPAPPSAQQMIRGYLGQLSSAAQRLLPKGDRLLFVGRTRAAIEARVGPLGSADDADAMAAALTALGDPQELAKQELERLHSARGRGSATPPVTLWKPAKESRRAARPRRPQPRTHSGGGQPWKPRPWPARGSAAIPEAPGTGAPPQPDQASGHAPGATPAAPGAEAAPPAPAAAAPDAARAGTPPPAGTVPAPGITPPAGTAPPAGMRPSDGLGRRDGQAPPAGAAEPEGERLGAVAGPGPEAGPGRAGADADTGPLEVVPGNVPAAPAERPSIVPGMGLAEEEPDGRLAGRPAMPAPLAEAAALARKNPLETVCVLLIGVGGLIFPFPMWLVGGLVALRSRHLDSRDKRLALLGPPLFAVVCLLILGAAGNGSYFHVLGHALHQFGLLLRVGCLLCAGYLVWRLRRGPRARKTPPWLRPR